MKNQLLLSGCIILQLTLCYGQADQQWLIVNGAGKSDYNTTSTPGFNVFSNTISGTDITLESVRHPNVNCNPKARNDIFVIYSDWSHFNSRLDVIPPSQGFFYPDPTKTDQNLNQLNHSFSGPRGKSILYGYMTNIYEGDDPPLSVKAKNGLSGQNTQTPYILGTSQPLANTITTNHDIVEGRDVTLIIKFESVGNGDILYFIKRPWHSNSNVGGTRDAYFAGSPIFPNGKFISVGDLAPLTGADVGYRFTNLPSGGNNPPYIYINLRSTSLLSGSFPTDPNIDPPNEMVFGIEINHNYATHEDLRASYDPNLVQVNSVCKKSNGDLFVNYHIQFRNSSFSPADNLAIKVSLIGQLDPHCIGPVKWYAGGNSNGRFEVKNQEINFTFDHSATVFSCDANKDPNLQLCLGYIEFCVKVRKESVELINDPSFSLKPTKTIVCFGSKDYPIEAFYDQSLVRPDTHFTNGVRNYSTTDCEQCLCTVVPSGHKSLNRILMVALTLILLYLMRKRIMGLFSSKATVST